MTEKEWYLRGYWEALSDFGIWKDGVQRIGCLETPIKELFERKQREVLGDAKGTGSKDIGAGTGINLEDY